MKKALSYLFAFLFFYPVMSWSLPVTEGSPTHSVEQETLQMSDHDKETFDRVVNIFLLVWAISALGATALSVREVFRNYHLGFSITLGELCNLAFVSWTPLVSSFCLIAYVTSNCRDFLEEGFDKLWNKTVFKKKS